MRNFVSVLLTTFFTTNSVFYAGISQLRDLAIRALVKRCSQSTATPPELMSLPHELFCAYAEAALEDQKNEHVITLCRTRMRQDNKNQMPLQEFIEAADAQIAILSIIEGKVKSDDITIRLPYDLYQKIYFLPPNCWGNPLWGKYYSFQPNPQSLELRFTTTPKLRTLPHEIQQMTQIRLLEIKCTFINELPDDLIRLKDLRTIRIDNAQNLRKVPASCFQLPNLYSLCVTNTQVSNVDIPPDASASLRKLILIKSPIENCGLVGLSRLVYLKDLSLNDLHLYSFPQDILALTHLENLTLSNTPQIHSLPPHITRLHSLRLLYISGTSIRELPKELANMTELHYLAISETPLLKNTNLEEKFPNIQFHKSGVY